MRIWIVCTGEAEGIWPASCDWESFEAAARQAIEDDSFSHGEKKLSAAGRLVCFAPCPASRRTAALSFEDGELREEPLLAPVAQRAFTRAGRHPLWVWREMARLQRLSGSPRQPESRRELVSRVEKLLTGLEKEGKDCMLVADCLLTAELLDRLRLRGYTVSRSGIFRYRPWERILLTRRDQRCGGCGHNCLLENPGCGVGRDKAARQKASLNR